MKRQEFLRQAGYGSLAVMAGGGIGWLNLSCCEINDISAQHPEVVARIKALFSEARAPHAIWKLR